MKAENLNNDMIPVGTTVHINPKDMKWECNGGDLISREALKKALFLACDTCRYCLYNNFEDIIDNAPTVFSCNACKNMGNERECVDCHDYSNYVHYEERPQGEWADHNTCPFCNHTYDWEYNFCPNCGADLRGTME